MAHTIRVFHLVHSCQWHSMYLKYLNVTQTSKGVILLIHTSWAISWNSWFMFTFLNSIQSKPYIGNGFEWPVSAIQTARLKCIHFRERDRTDFLCKCVRMYLRIECINKSICWQGNQKNRNWYPELWRIASQNWKCGTWKRCVYTCKRNKIFRSAKYFKIYFLSVKSFVSLASVNTT